MFGINEISSSFLDVQMEREKMFMGVIKKERIKMKKYITLNIKTIENS